MKLLLSLSMTALAMVALATGVFAGRGGGDQPDHFIGGKVIQGTKDNFKDLLAEHDYALVAFHAVWCGHCKRLAPNFVAASEELDGVATLISVELETAGGLTQEYGVRGFPTLKVFREGDATAYSGGRATSDIVGYMRKNAGPAVKSAADASAVDAIVESVDDVVAVAYVKDGSKAEAAFTKVAKRQREQFNFAATTDGAARKAACGSEETECVQVHLPKSQIHAKFDANDGVATSSEALGSAAQAEAFIWEASVPLVGHRTKDTEERFSKTGKPLVTAYAAVDYVHNLKKTNYWANRVRKVAVDNTDLTFAMANSKDYAKEMGDYGLSPKDADVSVAIRDPATGLKYVMEEDFSPEALAEFVAEYKAGSLSPHIKSAPVPKDYESEYVVGLTGKNFDELVTSNSGVNRLVAFTETWCGHCKKLIPAYEELAKRYADDDSVLIGRVEVSKNDIGPLFDGKIRGFPSIYFIPADGEPMKYASGRDVDSFVDYITKNSN